METMSFEARKSIEEVPGTPDALALAGMSSEKGQHLVQAARARRKLDFSTSVALVGCDNCLGIQGAAL
jgi:hypothetical protein